MNASASASYNRNTFPASHDAVFHHASNSDPDKKSSVLLVFSPVSDIDVDQGIIRMQYKLSHAKDARVNMNDVVVFDARLQNMRTLQMSRPEIENFVSNFRSKGGEYFSDLRSACYMFMQSGYIDTVKFEVLGSLERSYAQAYRTGSAPRMPQRGAAGSTVVGAVDVCISGVAPNTWEFWQMMCAMYDLVDLMTLDKFRLFVRRSHN